MNEEITPCTPSLIHYGMVIMTYPETVPKCFLMELKMVQLT